MAAKTFICVSIPATTNEAMREEMTRVAPEADLIELRVDSIARPDLDLLLRDRPRPVIVTNRPEREGGKFRGPENERVALLQKAIDLGAEHVDVELDAAHRVRRNPRTKLIVSHHDFKETPADLEDVYRRILDAKPDVAKLAVMATDIRDNLRMFDLMREAPVPTIGICMSELGRISRVLAPKFGGYLMFASVGKGRESGPGQLTAEQLRKVYAFERQGRDTQLYGLIADPVEHSLSPIMHNAAFHASGIDAVYVPFKVEGDPRAFLRDFAALGVKGYSVSIPHKEGIMAAMDDLDPLARRLGAMNTVVDRGGRWWGGNTDYEGALTALENALGGASPLRGKRVILFGAGGAGRALAFGCVDRGAEVAICNRTYERARSLAQDAGCTARPLDDLAGLMPYADVLINATPVGLWPEVDRTPVDADLLRPGMLVYDCIFNPLRTRLLCEAESRGCRVLSGVEWFLGQGAAQFRLWTGRAAPLDVMRRTVIEALEGAVPTTRGRGGLATRGRGDAETRG